MPNSVTIKEKIRPFNKRIEISGDKSISIRWVLLSSLATGVSSAKNLLISEDVIATIRAVRKLGIKVKLNGNNCTVFGKGFDGFNYNKKVADTRRQKI